ncbi:hypothetical protein QTP88_008764 [Uroleucon formosanum]
MTHEPYEFITNIYLKVLRSTFSRGFPRETGPDRKQNTRFSYILIQFPNPIKTKHPSSIIRGHGFKYHEQTDEAPCRGYAHLFHVGKCSRNSKRKILTPQCLYHLVGQINVNGCFKNSSQFYSNTMSLQDCYIIQLYRNTARFSFKEHSLACLVPPTYSVKWFYLSVLCSTPENVLYTILIGPHYKTNLELDNSIRENIYLFDTFLCERKKVYDLESMHALGAGVELESNRVQHNISPIHNCSYKHISIEYDSEISNLIGMSELIHLCFDIQINIFFYPIYMLYRYYVLNKDTTTKLKKNNYILKEMYCFNDTNMMFIKELIYLNFFITASFIRYSYFHIFVMRI